MNSRQRPRDVRLRGPFIRNTGAVHPWPRPSS
jgi:hypothetical protein